jgi:rSAM/selenodomain-associated transferase 1
MSSARTFWDGAAHRGENVLLIFVKYPIPGTVKTRFCPELDPEQAAALSRALAEDTLLATSKSDYYQTTVCFAPASAYRGVRSWLGPDVSLQEQCQGDLGSRQFDAIRRALAGGFRKVVIIGSDCPMITAADIEAAFDSLEGSELVVGPAEDGGYYLIGTRRPPLRSIFEGISWSTERVLRETVDRADEAGLSLKLLDVKYDLDAYADLQRHYRSVRDRSPGRPASRCLKIMESIMSGKL